MPKMPQMNGMSMAGSRPEYEITGCNEEGTMRVMKYEIGASMAARMEKTPDRRARRSGSSMAARRMK